MAAGLSILRSVGGIGGLELPLVEHGTQDSGVDQLGLLDESIDHGLGGCLHFLLDKAHHGGITLDLNVLPEVES